MMGIEASLKKLSIQLGQVMEANGQQDKGKALMHEQTHAITSSMSGYTTKEQDQGSFENPLMYNSPLRIVYRVDLYLMCLASTTSSGNTFSSK